MGNLISGNGCKVMYNNNILQVQTPFWGMLEFPINDIIAISDFCEAKTFNIGNFIIASSDTFYRFNYSKKQMQNFKDLYHFLKSKCPCAKKLIKEVYLDYKGGHPNLPNDGSSIIIIFENCLGIMKGIDTALIKYENILSLNLETKDQIYSRFTATRLALLGPFALAFKKKTKSTEKYLTIDFKDKNQKEFTAIFSGSNSGTIQSLIYKEYSNYISNYQNVKQNTHDNENSHKNVYDEIKQLKELLDMGAITQEEFDAKKRELLEL